MGGIGLSEKCPHRLLYLNTWIPVGETVGEGFEGTTLQNEVCPLGAGFEIKQASPFLLPVCSLCSDLCLKMAAQHPAPAARTSTAVFTQHDELLSLWNHKLNKPGLS